MIFTLPELVISTVFEQYAEEQTVEQTMVNPDHTQDEISEIFLSREDPEFESKKETLKQQGYRWNSERKSWQIPIAA